MKGRQRSRREPRREAKRPADIQSIARREITPQKGREAAKRSKGRSSPAEGGSL